MFLLITFYYYSYVSLHVIFRSLNEFYIIMFSTVLMILTDLPGLFCEKETQKNAVIRLYSTRCVHSFSLARPMQKICYANDSKYMYIQ